MTFWVPGSLAYCCLFPAVVPGRCNRQGPITKSPSEGETDFFCSFYLVWKPEVRWPGGDLRSFSLCCLILLSPQNAILVARCCWSDESRPSRSLAISRDPLYDTWRQNISGYELTCSVCVVVDNRSHGQKHCCGSGSGSGWGPWIRIRIRIRNLDPDPDPGEPKWPINIEKTKYHFFEVLDVFFWRLKASPVAWT